MKSNTSHFLKGARNASSPLLARAFEYITSYVNIKYDCINVFLAQKKCKFRN